MSPFILVLKVTGEQLPCNEQPLKPYNSVINRYGYQPHFTDEDTEV